MTNLIKCLFILTILHHSLRCTRGINQTRHRKQMEGFVVGAGFANIENYPHAVYLQMTCGGTAWTCGAAILNQKILITAAHCLQSCNLNRRRDSIKILAGGANIHKAKILRSGLKITIHKYYEERQVTNDIGLVVTDKNIPLGRNTKRIIIQPNFPEEYTGYVAGWGSTDDETGVTSANLKHVFQKLRSRNTCGLVGNLHSGMFCAGSTNYYDDHPAEGDSGSALVTKSHNGIGLVSFRVSAYPALLVYTNITYYYGWIMRRSMDMFCN